MHHFILLFFIIIIIIIIIIIPFLCTFTVMGNLLWITTYKYE